MKKRVISALVLTIIIIPLILIGGIPFIVGITAIGVVGLHELLITRETKKKFPLIMKLIAYLFTAMWILNSAGVNTFILSIEYYMLALLMVVFISPMVFYNNQEKYNLNDAWYLIGSITFISLVFNALIITRNMGVEYLLYIILIATATDIFALYTGKYIGVHKLSSISPKKTIEGLIGGVLMATFIASLFWYTVIDPTSSFIVIPLTLGLAVAGQVSDLTFSAIKRKYKKKDFANLIPGHGGILDRLDSLFFIILLFSLVYAF